MRGKTPYQYLTAVRVEKAMELLQAHLPVTAVCFSVGFESLSSFSGLFKRTVGLTPSAYLKQQQQLKIQVSRNPLQFVPACFAHQNGWTQKSNFEEVTE